MKAAEGAVLCKDIPELERLIMHKGYVIGGGMIYSLLLEYCSDAYITRLRGIFDADTFMPDLRAHGWRLTEYSEPRHFGDTEYVFEHWQV